jgi:hypothetical protein
MKKSRQPPGQRRSRPQRIRLPRFSKPFSQDVVIWREHPADGPSTLIRANFARTCMPRPGSVYDCGTSGQGAADLALNILNAFVPPRAESVQRWGVDQRDDDPLRSWKGVVSRFAIEHHQQFKREFIERLPSEGGRIDAERIREWIRIRRRA